MADAVSVEPKAKGVSYAQQVADARALAKTGQLEGALATLLQHEKTARLVRSGPSRRRRLPHLPSSRAARTHTRSSVLLRKRRQPLLPLPACLPAPGPDRRAPTPRLAQGGDISGTTELAVAMVEICWEASDHGQLNETISLLAKRRAQLKEAVAAVVRKATGYVDETSDAALKLKLIETLRAVSEGKMHVEVERARLTKTLAGIHEANGDAEEARKIMIETVVETLGGMDKREKTSFILEQVRLCLDTKEFVRAQIMARKINIKVFKDVEIEDLKLAYYALIVRYHLHSHNWLEIFRAYQSMWGTPALMSDEAARSRCLKLQCLYLVLSPYDHEQVSRERPSRALSACPLAHP